MQILYMIISMGVTFAVMLFPFFLIFVLTRSGQRSSQKR